MRYEIIAPQSLPPVTALPTGEGRSPDGREIGVDSRSLLRDGRRWLPVTGEFHYTRYPETEWRDELLKMREGGVDAIASYAFWIHHEEVEGEWDWSGRRDLRRFVRTCAELGLLFVARIGPWCHGEVRNGGLPDWLQARAAAEGFAIRSDTPGYLEPAGRLFREIAGQLRGLLWKDGGPVVSVQIENEYGGPAEHLLTLKRMAQEAGLDVPLYTRTGWPDLSTPMPPGELLPLFGGYADGFWDRSLAEMPPGYRSGFLFKTIRADGAIATDQLGDRVVTEDPDDALYPYFACEIGGGMERSYHRRIRIAPQDVETSALLKLGSGSNLQGYYVYHGGTNPAGRLSTMQESQATGYWNDLPTKSYDFQAPLGEFGQVRPHYHALRRMHLFLRDFGAGLAAMPTVLPTTPPANADDLETVRWAVRTDGRSGFVFVSNYQRLQPMPAKEDVQFEICLPDACLLVPSDPFTLPADCAFFWPFRLDLAGVQLLHATAQPICRLTEDDTDYFVFARTAGVPAEFVFDAAGLRLEASSGTVTEADGRLRVERVEAGTDVCVRLRTADGRYVALILLDEEQSLACWKGTLAGRQRLFLTRAALPLDGESLRLCAADPADLTVAIFPPPATVAFGNAEVSGVRDGLFQRFTPTVAPSPPVQVSWQQVLAPGPARVIVNGGEGVAEAPVEADFVQAAVWRLGLAGMPAARNLRLRIRYHGDVARLYLNGETLTDDFYNGNVFEVGLKRYAPDVYEGELLLKILPLRRDAPIYLPGDAWPDFSGGESVASLTSVEVIEEYAAELRVRP